MQILTLLLLLAAAPRLAPRESAAVAGGEVVVGVEDGDGGAQLVGVVRIDAPPDRVLAASMELEHLADVGGVASLQVYARGPDQVAARIEAKAFGMTRVYHVVQRADRERGRVDYTLDPSRPNDVASLVGSYEFFPAEGGTTLLVNRVSGDTGGWVPAALLRWVAARTMREKLKVIRAAAEGEPGT